MGSFGKLFTRKPKDAGSSSNQASAAQASGNTASAYQTAIDLFKANRTAEALERFEQLVKIEPSSASIQYMLGAAYARCGSELTKDNDAISPWLKKSVMAFKTAVDLAKVHGGLTLEQIKNASESALHGERVIERYAPSIPEEHRRKIYADLMETIDNEFLLGTNLVGEMEQASHEISFVKMQEAITKNAATAETNALDKVSTRHNVTRGQLLAIKEEGREKKWFFHAVARR
jgi:tetratricopeptide (TPR) repeat protein